MSKFRCQCNHVISTSVYPCPFDGWVYGDEAEDEFETKLEETLASFMTAVRDGTRVKWISEFFSGDYPQDLNDSSVISDIITKIKGEYLLGVLECEACGRIHVQEHPGVNKYRTYSPEDGKYFGVLRKKIAEPAAS
jgi:hypothetical protein